MFSSSPARIPRRARRVLLAAVVAACALPAAAQASVVQDGIDGLEYRAGSGERNVVKVVDAGGGVEINDSAGITSRTTLCFPPPAPACDARSAPGSPRCCSATATTPSRSASRSS
jgi:opacity protein-like surface antigen